MSVDALLAQAQAAQKTWSLLPLHQRIQPLKALRSRILERGQGLAETMWRELGKPWGDSFTGEVIASADMVAQWKKHGPRLLAHRSVKLDPLSYAKKTCRVELVPKGVIGLITPWNMPVAIPLRTIVPALIAGNAVLWKPSELAPETAHAVRALFEGLFPDGVLALCEGDGQVGAQVVRSGVDHLSFTGSVATGRAIEKVCAELGITCGLELGGKDAAIVLDDAPFERTTQGVMWGAFNMTGQNCSSIERVLVQRGISEKFIAAVVDATRALHCGPQYAIDDCDVGPLASERQLQLVEQHVADAKAKGAKVLVGGERLGGRFYAPTVLVDVPTDALIWREETFGPVLPIRIVETPDEGVALANDSRFGLAASVWTSDFARGEAMLGELRTGVAMVNNACFTGALAMAPWGGVKDSGHGATNSEFALYELVRPRTILIDRNKQVREMWWYPFTPAFRLLTLALSRLLRGQLSALPQVAGQFPKRFKRAS